MSHQDLNRFNHWDPIFSQQFKDLKARDVDLYMLPGMRFTPNGVDIETREEPTNEALLLFHHQCCLMCDYLVLHDREKAKAVRLSFGDGALLVSLCQRTAADVRGQYVHAFYWVFDEPMASYTWDRLRELTRIDFLPPTFPFRIEEGSTGDHEGPLRFTTAHASVCAYPKYPLE